VPAKPLPGTGHPPAGPTTISPTLVRTGLTPFETKSLRLHALYLFLKRVNLLLMSRRFGLPCISFAQLVERFLNGKLRGVGHVKSPSTCDALEGAAADPGRAARSSRCRTGRTCHRANRRRRSCSFRPISALPAQTSPAMRGTLRRLREVAAAAASAPIAKEINFIKITPVSARKNLVSRFVNPLICVKQTAAAPIPADHRRRRLPVNAIAATARADRPPMSPVQRSTTHTRAMCRFAARPAIPAAGSSAPHLNRR
jgi:hypothetical protein